jgi:hypothetical protein
LRLSFAVAVLVVCTTLAFGASASAAPVATTAPQYAAYGAVFPDPLAVCQQNCDPSSRGRTNATQFIQYQEFVDALEFMNTNEDWRRYMEVWPLDGKIGDGGGTKVGDAMWPGNNLSKLEWAPKEEYQSAGIATSNRGRQKSDLIVIRVTDENVPDADKKRYALSLSIHGIERAGAEGGIRAMEEIVTAISEGRGDESILPKEVREGAPSWNQVLANTIIYFTLPNPDGWRRGSVGDTDKGPGVFFQRYNGNGVDPNRDWPDVGYTFRPYSGGSEPETRAFQNFYREVEAKGGQFAAGDDLHGMPFADALSYTLLPHGSHSLDKDFRIREASKLINRAQYHATKWSPYIIDNDEGPPNCPVGTLGDSCDAIYAQTWGSVYDTINYTTTGSLGDWFDSEIGLGADGIDNEMAFSHIDRNIAFEPHGEQLHVAGNKAIIYSHIADMLRPPGAAYSVPGANGYVPNFRVKRERQQVQGDAPPGTSPQADEDDKDPSGAEPGTPPSSYYEFAVKRDAKTYNGGMRVDVRTTNFQGVATGTAALKVQCQGCDEHPGTKEEGDWITVAEDFNQDFLYAQAGLTAAVNLPDANRSDGSPVKWRALVTAQGGVPTFSIDFTSGPATSDGNTEGGSPPFLTAYDVANTDFFEELKADALADDDEFDPIDPAKVISGEQALSGFSQIVLADNAMPGYTGLYKEENRPTGPPTQGFMFEHTTPTTPGQTQGCLDTPTAREEFPFEIKPNEANALVDIRISWSLDTSDYDLYLGQDTNANGKWDNNPDANPETDDGEPQYGSESAGFVNTGEQIVAARPPSGRYVIVVANCSAPSEVDPWTGAVEFRPYPAPGESVFSAAEKDTWMTKLREWVSAGGRLVLTDSAVRALPELSSVPGSAINQALVYVGQTSFQICTKWNEEDASLCSEEEGSTKETLDHRLAKDVAQPAGRFGSGLRRQTFEPTPLGFAIQNTSGSNSSYSSQYDIDQTAFQAAGGDPAGSSVSSSATAAAPLPARTVLGQLPVGQGRITVSGGLLPQPTNAYDHPLGLEPHALTYTGYILFCNLVECKYEAKPRPQLPNAPAPPGPVQLPIDARVHSPLLASNTLRGRRIRLRIRKLGVKRISHLELQYRRTGRGTNRSYRKLRPRLKPTTKKIAFTKGKVGQTYLFRIRAIGKNGITSSWRYSRTVYPYDDRGKGRRYSKGWTRLKNKRAWLGGYTRSSRRGASLYFATKGGGRVYLIGQTGPKGGRAVLRRAGQPKMIVSFRTRKVRNRRVVAVINRTDKRALRFRLRVLRGPVTVDGIGVRRR